MSGPVLDLATMSGDESDAAALVDTAEQAWAGARAKNRNGTAVALRSPAGSMADLLYLAVEKGTPVAELRELVALHETMSQRQAQQDFAAAMAQFQAACPSIKKGSTASIVTTTGSKFSYTFAELDEYIREVKSRKSKQD